MRVMLYAFKPYGPYSDNVSQRVLAAIRNKPGRVKQFFDVCFDRQMFRKAVMDSRPDLVIGMGQHPRARKVRIERKAKNQMKTESGRITRIDRDGPEFLRTSFSLPTTAITTVTYDAGSYVCNYSMYVISRIAKDNGIHFAFLHLPRILVITDMTAYVEVCCKSYRV